MVCPVINVGVYLKNCPSLNLSLYVMPNICEPLVGLPIVACVKKHPHLVGLELADFSGTGKSMPVDVSIGSDYYWEFFTGSVCRGVGGPAAIHIKLGLVLSGPSHDKLELDHCAINLNVTHVLHADIHFEDPHTLDDQLRAFWELEALGIRDRKETLYDDFTGVVKFKNRRYQVPLPADVESMSMPEPCSRELKSTCKLSHNLLTIEGKAIIGDLDVL